MQITEEIVLDEDTTQAYDDTQNETYDDNTQTTETVDQEVTELPEETEQATQTEETVSQPVEELEVEEDDSYNPFVGTYQPSDVNLPQLDFSKLPVDENGNVDVNVLAETIQSQVAAATQAAVQQSTALVNELEEKRREELLWQKATEKYPELKDKQYAQDVQAYRFGKFNLDLTSNGAEAKMMSPAQAAAAFNKRFGAAKAEGIKQGTENVRVQESAYAEPTSGTAAKSTSDSQDLIARMRSGDRGEADAASQEWLKKRLFGE